MKSNELTLSGSTRIKYFVECSGFFSKSRHLLCIQKDGLSLEPIKATSSPNPIVLFKDLLNIEISPRNNREFYLKTKKGSSFTLHCSARNECICEIYRIWDIHNAGALVSENSPLEASPRLPKISPQYKVWRVISSDSKIALETELVIYRTHLILLYQQSNVDPMTKDLESYLSESQEKELGFKMFKTSLLFSNISLLHKTSKGLIIETADSHTVYDLTFVSSSEISEAISKIQTNYEEHTGSLIEVKANMIREYQTQSMREAIESPKYIEYINQIRNSLPFHIPQSPQHFENLYVKTLPNLNYFDSPTSSEYVHSKTLQLSHQNDTRRNTPRIDLSRVTTPKYMPIHQYSGFKDYLNADTSRDNEYQKDSSSICSHKSDSKVSQNTGGSHSRSSANIDLSFPQFGEYPSSIEHQPFRPSKFQQHGSQPSQTHQVKSVTDIDGSPGPKFQRTLKYSQTIHHLNFLRDSPSSRGLEQSPCVPSQRVQNDIKSVNISKFNKIFSASFKAFKVLENFEVFPVILGFIEAKLFEIDIKTYLVLQKYDLAAAEYVSQSAIKSLVQVVFRDGVKVTYIMIESQTEFVANIMGQFEDRNLSIKNPFCYQKSLLHSKLPDFRGKIKGCVQEELDLDYQVKIIQNFCVANNESQFYQSLQLFILNGNLHHFSGNEPTPLYVLVKLLRKKVELIKTKKFNELWESFQSSEQAKIKEDFLGDGSEISSRREKHTASPYAKSSTESTPASKDSSVELDSPQVLEILYRTEEIMKGVIVLMSSRVYFRQFASDKREKEIYVNFFEDLFYLLDSNYPVLNHLSACLIKAIISFPDFSEKKLETMNRKMLIANTQIVKKISKILEEKIFKPRFNSDLMYHTLAGCFSILKELVEEKKDFMDLEDKKVILDFISGPLFICACNFAIRTRLCCLHYSMTIILNSFFRAQEYKSMFSSMQSKCLQNSPLILFQIIQGLSSFSRNQRTESLIFLISLLQENKDACLLIKRVFPEYMIQKVENAPADLNNWKLFEWTQLFTLLQKDTSTPTEQWNEAFKSELLNQLSAANQRFLYKLGLPSDGLTTSKVTSEKRRETLMNLRWNFEEFEVNYQTVVNSAKVGRYFLEGIFADGENPKLLVNFSDPKEFWNDLNLHLQNSENTSEASKLIKIMILMYSKYFKEIKAFKLMNTFLKYLVNPRYFEVQYLIVQLIYASLSIDASCSSLNKNLVQFTEAQGIGTLCNLLCGLFFTEDHSEHLGETDGRDSGIYNYTNLSVPLRRCSCPIKDFNIIFFILNIFKLTLKRQANIQLEVEAQNKLLYPSSKLRCQIMEQNTIQCIMNTLLISDDDLIVQAVELISNYLLSRESIGYLLYSTPIIEFLLFNINIRTYKQRMSLLLHFYEYVQKDSGDLIRKYLDTSFEFLAFDVIQKALKGFPVFRYLPKHLVRVLLDSNIDDFGRVLFASSHETPTLIWNSSMFQSLQQNLLLQIQPYRQELIDFSNVYGGTTTQSRANLPRYMMKTPDDIYANLQDEVQCGPIFLRIWNSKKGSEVELSNVDIGNFINGLYGLLHSAMLTLAQGSESQRSSPRLPNTASLQDFEHMTLKRNRSCHTLENINKSIDEDLLIILEAHAKAIKEYKIQRYQCFREVLQALEHFCETLSEGNYSPYLDNNSLSDTTRCIYILCRIIYYSIRIENSENLDLFISLRGLFILLESFQVLIKNMNIARYGDNENHYLDLRLLQPKIKILEMIVRIILFISTTRPTEFELLPQEEKLQMFLGLQIAAKASVIIFEATLTKHPNKDSRAPEVKKNSISEYLIEVRTLDALNKGSGRGIPDSFTTIDGTSLGSSELLIDIYFDKVYMLTRGILDVWLQFSVRPMFLPILIRAGILWRCIEFLTYYIDVPELGEKNYRKMLINIEDACLIFRNTLIFANEAYISRSRKSPGDPEDLRIVSNEEKSHLVELLMNQYGEANLKFMARFYVAVTNLLGKLMINLLLAHYMNPLISPRIQDKEDIDNFIKMFANSYYDPSTLWNEDTRNELRTLMVNQLGAINSSKAKLSFNRIESFQFSVHKKHLLIQKIFVSLYNKNPRWKIHDPKEFLESTMEKITSLWKSIKDSQATANYGNNEISATLFNLNEALVAVSNIVTFQASKELLMSESKITPIAALLNEKRTKRIEDPYVVNLKMTAISIFTNLSLGVEGANILLENSAFVKNGLSLLRSNTKEGSTVIGAFLRIISNMTLKSHLRQVLIDVGIWIVLLKVVLKTEIHPKVCRKEALRLFINILKHFDKDSIASQTLELLFPENIKRLFFVENDLEVILNYLDNGYNSPKIIWTKSMRYEVLYTIGTELDKVCYTENEKIPSWLGPARMHPPIFPEIQENICINGIYLRAFNKNPVFDEEDQPLNLINNIADYGDMIYDEFLEKTIAYEKSESLESTAMSVEDQKKLDRLSCAMVTILTSLLLCLDRFIYPGVKKSKSVSENPGETPRATKTSAKDFDESVGFIKNIEATLEDKPILFLYKCTELFEQPKVHLHILSTMLQILYLLADDKNGFDFLRSNNIIQFFSNFLCKLVPDYQGPTNFTYVEEKIGLYFLLKILLKDQDLIPEATALCLEYLEQIHFGPKAYLKDLTQTIIKVLDEYSDPEKETENVNPSVPTRKKFLNAHFALADVWKPISQGFNPYQAKNTQGALRKKSKDSDTVYPVLSDFSFISLPHMSVQNVKYEQMIKSFIARIVDENSNSKDCIYTA